MSESDLKEKLERWFDPHPEGCLPVQAAAIALALKHRVESEGQEHEDAQGGVVNALDSVIDVLYEFSCIDRTGEMDHKLADKREKFLGGLPPEQRSLFLSASFNEHPSAFSGLDDSLVKRFDNLLTREKRDFLTRAKNISGKADSSYSSLDNALSGAVGRRNYPQDLRNILFMARKNLVGMLNALEHDSMVEHGVSLISPEDGPKTVREMYLCCSMYIKANDILNAPFLTSEGAPPGAFSNIALLAFVRDLDKIQSDIPPDKKLDMWEKDLNDAQGIGKTHSLNMVTLSGLIHYFLEHNQEKLEIRDYARLRSSLENIHQGQFSDAVRAAPHFFIDTPTQEIVEMYDKLMSKFQVDYHKPSVDEVAQSTVEAAEEKFKGNPAKRERVIRKFEETRAQKPENMDEIVLLHHAESQEVRDLRKNLFKRAKTEFIADLGENHVQELEAIGLSHDEIQGMRETGKIPEGSGLTVEHIVDREHGGTNHTHNFILMSGEINALKNELKQSQTHGIDDRGSWIISWTPKRNEDGTYPKVFSEESLQDEPDQALEEHLQLT